MMPNELSDRLWCLAARIGKVVDALPDTRLDRHVPTCRELVRRAGAPALRANYDEARVGESRADFAHKINVALKELVETRGWLRFIIRAQLLPARRIEALVESRFGIGTRKIGFHSEGQAQDLRARCGLNDQ
ncbi:MAG: four helix bundle protein [Verrucomicrobiota bacterium]|jgi:four helix bundle protein